jgi:hypothetical protein
MDGIVVVIGFLASIITIGQFAKAIIDDAAKRREQTGSLPSSTVKPPSSFPQYPQAPVNASPASVPQSYIPPRPAPYIPPSSAPSVRRSGSAGIRIVKVLVLVLSAASLGLSIYRYGVLNLPSTTPTGSTHNTIELTLSWTAGVIACIALLRSRPRHYRWAVGMVFGCLLFPIGGFVYALGGPKE